MTGIHGDDAHDPVDLMIAVQKNLELMQEMGRSMYKLQHRRPQAVGTHQAADVATSLAAEKAKHSAALVDLRRLASKMGTEYQQQMEDALAAAHMHRAETSTSRTLHIR